MNLEHCDVCFVLLSFWTQLQIIPSRFATRREKWVGAGCVTCTGTTFRTGLLFKVYRVLIGIKSMEIRITYSFKFHHSGTLNHYKLFTNLKGSWGRWGLKRPYKKKYIRVILYLMFNVFQYYMYTVENDVRHVRKKLITHLDRVSHEVMSHYCLIFNFQCEWCGVFWFADSGIFSLF